MTEGKKSTDKTLNKKESQSSRLVLGLLVVAATAVFLKITLWSNSGDKLTYLIKQLESYKSHSDKVLFLTNNYELISLEDHSALLKQLGSINPNAVHESGPDCWLKTFKEKKERAELNEFIRSGGFLGYAADLYHILNSHKQQESSGHLFYTKFSLNKSHLVSGELNEMVIITSDDNTHKKLFSGVTGVDANDFEQISHENFKVEKCTECAKNAIKLANDQSKWPQVTIGVVIETTTPFIREFFQKLGNLNYPKQKLSVFINNKVPYHETHVNVFVDKYKSEYSSLKVESTENEKDLAIRECKQADCQFYLKIESLCHLDNPDALKLLVEQNISILAPVLGETETSWTNVWNRNIFESSPDLYKDIVEGNKKGVWKVPTIAHIALVKGDLVKKEAPSTKLYDFVFNRIVNITPRLLKSNIFVYATNAHNYGHLVNHLEFDITHPRPDLYEILTNKQDWIARYIQPELIDILAGKLEPQQPCQDVYFFPFTTEEFCDDLIFTMEDYGNWSTGVKNEIDKDGYPSNDIVFGQIYLQDKWDVIIEEFLVGFQRKFFPGFASPTQEKYTFVARFRHQPGQVDHLDPHHDESLFTTNLALNSHDEFEGGGVIFIRKNCSVSETRKGWAMLHPGKLTHYHQSIPVRSGTRYIAVTFVIA